MALLVLLTPVSKAVLAQGQTLYINYGHKSNEELLLGYGFVLPDNIANFVKVTIGAAARPGAHVPAQTSVSPD